MDHVRRAARHGAEAPLIPVIKTFFERGGRMIDSSPMYGYTEAVIGDLLTETSSRPQLFSATKIWTPLAAKGAGSSSSRCKLWGFAALRPRLRPQPARLGVALRTLAS